MSERLGGFCSSPAGMSIGEQPPCVSRINSVFLPQSLDVANVKMRSGELTQAIMECERVIKLDGVTEALDWMGPEPSILVAGVGERPEGMLDDTWAVVLLSFGEFAREACYEHQGEDPEDPTTTQTSDTDQHRDSSVDISIETRLAFRSMLF